MDEQVREWVKKKMQKISTPASTTVSTSSSTTATIPSPAAEPVQEKPEKVEKEIASDKEIKKQTEVKQYQVKRRREIKQPVKGSVDVEDKISEYVQDVVAVEKPVVEGSATEKTTVEESQDQGELPMLKIPIYKEINEFPRQVPKLSERKPGLFTKRRILIMIISSVAGAVAGYLLLQFLIG